MRWIGVLLLSAGAAMADPVEITPDVMSVMVETPSGPWRSCTNRTTQP